LGKFGPEFTDLESWKLAKMVPPNGVPSLGLTAAALLQLQRITLPLQGNELFF
jgi:hypothetical protein